MTGVATVLQSPGEQAATALRWGVRGFWSVALFSGVVNLLMLAGPLYMLQIYDRVLSSRSVPTLIALTLILIGAYVFQGILDVIRTKIVVRSAASLDEKLGSLIHDVVVRMSIASRRPGEALQPVRDLDLLRAFLMSTGPIAIVDLPWMPVFLVICFAIHPWLGALSALGIIILFALAVQTERASRQLSRALLESTGKRAALMEVDRRNSETVIAMGMTDSTAERWAATNDRFVAASGQSSEVANFYASLTRAFRLLLQSAILGLGAYLVLKNELTAGAMIAASIMMGRALAPIETAIGNWRGFVNARESRRRLMEVLRTFTPPRATTALPRPHRNLEVRELAVVAPGGRKPIVANINFDLRAGEALGVVGPSGAGKSSLIRALVGVWPAANGLVRLDGASLDQWDSTARGQFIGYVSQSIELFDDTVAANIARMEPDADSVPIIAAAQAAGAHDLIVKLPMGYDTPIGESGATLSAGQRQRIALARAMYKEPFLVVLDEPNSNLDREGEHALLQTIGNLKAKGAIIILIAHRPSALVQCDKVLLLMNGMQKDFGPRDAILRKYFAPPPSPLQTVQAMQPAGVNLKVVGEGSGGVDK